MKRPNFLVLMTDQQRGDCLSIEGHPALLTPNMDSIAGAGARFRRCYSTCPFASPPAARSCRDSFRRRTGWSAARCTSIRSAKSSGLTG